MSSLRDKIYSGFYYMIKTDTMTVITGVGGAINYLDALEEAGLSEEHCKLLVSEDADKFYDLRDIEFIKINETEN